MNSQKTEVSYNKTLLQKITEKQERIATQEEIKKKKARDREMLAIGIIQATFFSLIIGAFIFFTALF
jgi:hypothetical protein